MMSEFFGDIRPAATLVGMAGLIRPELLVEIEVDAIIGSGREIVDIVPESERTAVHDKDADRGRCHRSRF